MAYRSLALKIPPSPELPLRHRRLAEPRAWIPVCHLSADSGWRVRLCSPAPALADLLGQCCVRLVLPPRRHSIPYIRPSASLLLSNGPTFFLFFLLSLFLYLSFFS